MSSEKFGRGLLHQYGALLVILTAVLDLTIIAGVQVFTVYANGETYNNDYLFALALVLILFVSMASTRSLYRSYRTVSITNELAQLSLFWLISVGSLNALAFVFEDIMPQFPELLIAWYLITWVVLLLQRFVIRQIAHKLRTMGFNFRTMAIVGATESGVRLYQAVQDNPWMGFRFAGFFDERAKSREQLTLGTITRVGDFSELFHLIDEHAVQVVYIAIPMSAQQRVVEIIEQLASRGVSVYYVPDFYTFDLLNTRWESIGSQPVVGVVDTPFIGRADLIKRTEDLILSFSALVALSIPMLIVAVLIRLESSGPALYRQRRYGLDGEPFEIWKFRSMYVRSDDQVFKQATRGDSRITRIGAFIRRTSIDELPQLFNVLFGQMSLVGPRPHPIALDEEHQPLIHRYRVRFKVKPGITGWAQVNGYRGETDTVEKMEGRVRYDLEYINHWSLVMDIKIILLTVLRVFKDENAF
ncbi:MAG: undecaprenyl-phosphate glucose phosphotransferase [Pseudomonadota bacterium]